MASWNEDIKKELQGCGVNVFIGHYTIFTNPKKVLLNDNVRVDPLCLITTQLTCYSNVQICSGAVLGGGSQQKITLGNWSFVGYGSKLFTASEDYSGDFGPVNEFWGKNKIFRGDITFNDYSGVASDVIVMPGCILPEGCLIGAKSFVYDTKKLKPWAIYWGNPLKLQRQRNEAKVRELANDPKFNVKNSNRACFAFK